LTYENLGLDAVNDLMALTPDKNEFAFVFFGWSGILLKARQKTVAFDLCSEDKLRNITNLDIQLNSHVHRDHFSLKATTNLFQQTRAKIVVEPQIYEDLKNDPKIPGDALFSANPDKPLSIDDFLIRSVKGSHLCPISLFHVEWNSFNVFHGADSDYIPLKKYHADVAFIPTGSPSPTCSPEKGLRMALDLKPAITIPMHGTKIQIRKFKKLHLEALPETRIVIPEKHRMTKVKL
jgi:L-ascorbate metabolism protein UlaG (beta-lactamase superfamily)